MYYNIIVWARNPFIILFFIVKNYKVCILFVEPPKMMINFNIDITLNKTFNIITTTVFRNILPTLKTKHKLPM